MAEVRWLDDGEARMWRGYLDSTRLLMRALDRQLENDAQMSLSDFEALVQLSEAPGRRLRMSQLADAMTATRSGVTRTVNRLAAEGWLVRADCDEDGRGSYAELTEAGMDRLRAVAPGHVAAVRRHLFDLISVRDVGLFAHAYEQIRDNLLDGRQVETTEKTTGREAR
ncbi:MarR family transcriptional regulator [Mycobacterium sp. M1]|uniref:MarR family transcriptional regulator n=1 Tax=Mycolicibacter acidiphilus TaxID=2835306 RepID=A0ABS5RDT5_9MYCO|nr:MarR family transcriptional regulator [Mycolicibacter acidiphilus]MBS9532450.1 MarR family transcriptional regulator [Mycolicibacter acidiphilus]